LALVLSGCDKLSSTADQEVADAEAIGFACRVSLKTPDDCMKENEAYSPAYVLDGWKLADEDIKTGKLDPSMGGNKLSVILSETPDSETPATGMPSAEAAQPSANNAAPFTETKPAEVQPSGS
jgi:hypothetical protein